MKAQPVLRGAAKLTLAPLRAIVLCAEPLFGAAALTPDTSLLLRKHEIDTALAQRRRPSRRPTSRTW
jgi:hypothetical protein